jgi:6-phosphogluconolactonase
MRTAVLVCDDALMIAQRALDLLVSQSMLAIRMRGEAHLALTGGSSAILLFEALRDEPRARRVDWSRMHVWPGDERFVPTADPESNWGTARREWLDRPDGPGIPASNLHPVPVDEALAGGHDPAWAAERYAAEVESRLPRRHGLPAFDVILLGVGTDGHILSAFPRSDPVLASSGTATAVEAPTHIGPHLPRVTLVPRLLGAAGLILVMVPGMGKRDAVRVCFGSGFDPERFPAQLAIRPNAVWLLDQGCAAGWLIDEPAA